MWGTKQNSRQISRNFHNYTEVVMNECVCECVGIKRQKRSSGSDGFIQKIHENISIHRTKRMNVEKIHYRRNYHYVSPAAWELSLGSFLCPSHEKLQNLFTFLYSHSYSSCDMYGNWQWKCYFLSICHRCCRNKRSPFIDWLAFLFCSWVSFYEDDLVFRSF